MYSTKDKIMAFKNLILLLILHILSSSGKAEQQTLCAGRAGTIKFMPAGIDGNVTGFTRFNRQVSGKQDESFLSYNTESGKITHLLHGREINVTNNYLITFQTIQKGDEGKYTVAIPVKKGANNAVTVTATIDLTVKDPCFEEAKEEGDCMETECFTSTNGYLTFKGKNLTSMKVSVCDSSNSGVYNCCSPMAKCQSLKIADPQARKDGSDNSTLTIALPVAIILALLIVTAIIAAVLILKKRRRKDEKGTHMPLSPVAAGDGE